MSKYDIITHGNTLKIKNKSLNNIKDRIDFFVPNKEYVVCFEISMCFPYLEYDITYEYVSSMIINGYMSSPSHRCALIIDGDSETPLKIKIHFKTSLNPKSKKLYNTGIVFVE
jgi:hypothetical protein